MIHDVWVLDIKIRGHWIPKDSFIGDNPIRHDWLSFLANTFNYNINDLRIRRIHCIEELAQFSSKPFIQLAPHIRENDEIHFSANILVLKDNIWVTKETCS